MAIAEIEIHEKTALVRMNRPDARNAMSSDLTEALDAHFTRCEEDDDIWQVVLTGNGPVFCAGADLKEVSAGTGRRASDFGFGGLTERPRTKPMIAAVDGAAVAGGCEMALACDLIVASTAARFGLPEVQRSLVAAAGGLARLPKRIPHNVAMELALTGDTITAERAHQFGMVNHLCEPGDAVETALALAEKIGSMPPIAVRFAKECVDASLIQEESDVIKLSQRRIRDISSTEDFKEGPLAFIEKRPAVWTGR